ncbi:hypothetical protein [Corynebacterium aquilae]|uniref:Uncharacterized protein n=1 Tax=Corynebacterium aquilae DSM 44791 TaxID=1431546 RepID=A0A1L7CF97_9CORY|nr:hypothetical protein [Corynebacterium aquilae]APT84505.1 hypothetical protein CAQU_04890 [Corynebacterium aquilae DSM 44791]
MRAQIDLKHRVYDSLSFFERESVARSDFYALLDFLLSYAGIAVEELGDDARSCFKAGYPVDAFDEIAYLVSQRDVGVPDWWFEQLALIPIFQAPYEPEEVIEMAASMKKITGVPAPWEDSQTAA